MVYWDFDLTAVLFDVKWQRNHSFYHRNSVGYPLLSTQEECFPWKGSLSGSWHPQVSIQMTTQIAFLSYLQIERIPLRVKENLAIPRS